MRTRGKRSEVTAVNAPSTHRGPLSPEQEKAKAEALRSLAVLIAMRIIEEDATARDRGTATLEGHQLDEPTKPRRGVTPKR